MKCASGSVGGARPCQGRGRGFESRLALLVKEAETVINSGLRYFFVCLQVCTQLYPPDDNLTTERLQRFTNQFVSIFFRQWIVYVAESGGKFSVS